MKLSKEVIRALSHLVPFVIGFAFALVIGSLVKDAQVVPEFTVDINQSLEYSDILADIEGQQTPEQTNLHEGAIFLDSDSNVHTVGPQGIIVEHQRNMSW